MTDSRNTSDPDVAAGFDSIDAAFSPQGDTRAHNWLMDVTTVGIVVAEADSGRILLSNSEASRMFGYAADDLLGQAVEVLIPERLRGAHIHHRRDYGQAPRARAICTGVTLFGLRRDGTEFPVEVGLTPLDTQQGLIVVTTIVDISARWHAEDALQRSQKLEAVGQLAGGIAHDFNNLLTIISGNLQLLEERLSHDDPNRAMVLSAANAASRGSELVRGLLTLSRTHTTQPQRANIAVVCRRLLPILERTLGEHIEIRIEVAPDPWDVVADIAHLESALLNLALNARDAMEGGGRLAIQITNRQVGAPLETSTGMLQPGEYVMIALSDTGCGMDPETLSRIFEPFFTTKSDDKGTGLGIPMVFAFVKRSDGHVIFASEPGAGTTVTLFLPRAYVSSMPTGVAEESISDCDGDELILVVEDDDAVGELAVGILSGLGYRVLRAHDGESALQILEREPDIALMFIDLVLSGAIDGMTVAARARQHAPSLKVLFTSGYPREVALRSGRLAADVDILPKPYRREVLAQSVRDLLDARQPDS